MPRRDEGLEKVTLRLHKGDKEVLNEFYPHLGHNKVIRTLVHRAVKQLQERVNERATPGDIEIEIGD